MQTLIIKGDLPSMNEIIAMAKRGRGNYQPYAKVKKEISDMIYYECLAQKIHPLMSKTDFTITWVCKDTRKDKDNIMAGFKFIGDGLQHAGILKNDGWKEIGNITHKFEIGKKQIKIEMEESK